MQGARRPLARLHRVPVLAWDSAFSLCSSAARGLVGRQQRRVLAAGSVKHVVSPDCRQWSGLRGRIAFLGTRFIESSVFSARISSHYIPYNS